MIRWFYKWGGKVSPYIFKLSFDYKQQNIKNRLKNIIEGVSWKHLKIELNLRNSNQRILYGINYNSIPPGQLAMYPHLSNPNTLQQKKNGRRKGLSIRD